MKAYQVRSRNNSQTQEIVTQLLCRDGQLLLPWLELAVQSGTALDQVIDDIGRSAIEALLNVSAQQVAGVKHPGKAAGAIRWHGRQGGVVPLLDRQVRVAKPRLRRKEGGEVEVPAYTQMRSHRETGRHMLRALVNGLSTRRYAETLPRMAEAVGVSRSSVSREATAASAAQLQELAERNFKDVELLVIFLDGIRLGRYHVLAAVGVDSTGKKHFLGLKEGSSENAVVATGLLEDLAARGVKPDARRLFVIDGSKALRQAIDSVYGSTNPVQRCRRHKERNVLGHLPRDEQRRVRRVLKNAWALPAREGMAHIQKEAKRLQEEHPSAAASLREGLAEMFTVSRLGLPPTLSRGLCSTNVIEATFSGTRNRTGRVRHWQSGDMALRWSASALMATETKYKKLMGYASMSFLKAVLHEPWEGDVGLSQAG